MKQKMLLVMAAAGLLQLNATAQSLTPTLVGSSGDFSSNSSFSISSSVGEPAVTSLGPVNNLYLTQGFQQPSSTGIQALTVTFASTASSCVGANDGYGVASVISGKAPFTYTWAPAGGTVVTSALTDTSDLLAPGTYTVVVTDANGFSVTDSVIISEEQGNCGVVVYSGITPNGDGNNDLWLIDYIELYPDNEVSIFNRWGERVWHGAGYDNQSIVWNGKNMSGQPLPDATYYYVIRIEGKTLTGWVEVTQ